MYCAVYNELDVGASPKSYNCQRVKSGDSDPTPLLWMLWNTFMFCLKHIHHTLLLTSSGYCIFLIKVASWVGGFLLCLVDLLNYGKRACQQQKRQNGQDCRRSEEQ